MLLPILMTSLSSLVTPPYKISIIFPRVTTHVYKESFLLGYLFDTRSLNLGCKGWNHTEDCEKFDHQTFESGAKFSLKSLRDIHNAKRTD